MAVTKEKKKELVSKYQTHKKDTGSTEVQISLLTESINELTKHQNNNPKDYSSQKGLLTMVGERKRLLNYLQRVNLDSYRRIIDQLSIRS